MMLTGFRKRTLLIGICHMVQCHSLGSSCRVGGHGPRWHCHLRLHSGRLACRLFCSSAGPPLSVLWESLLLGQLHCPIRVEGGYSYRPTVLPVSLSPLARISPQAIVDVGHHTLFLVLVQPALNIKPSQGIGDVCVWVSRLNDQHIQVLLSTQFSPAVTAAWCLANSGVPI